MEMGLRNRIALDAIQIKALTENFEKCVDCFEHNTIMVRILRFENCVTGYTKMNILKYSIIFNLFCYVLRIAIAFLLIARKEPLVSFID